MRTSRFAGAYGRRTIHISARLSFGLSSLLFVACSDEKPSTESSVDAGAVVVEGEVQDRTTTHPDLPPLPGFSSCTIETASVTKAASPHLSECTPIAYPTHPGTSGPHYAVWAAWRSYRGPIPEPYLVHNLEHGGVVLHYNCLDGCPEMLGALDEIIAAFPDDPRCAPPVRARFVVVEDPALDVPLAAAAWGKLYRATCLDTEGLSEWIRTSYAKAPEDTCADGFDFTSEDAGTIAVCTEGRGGTGSPSMNSPD